MQPSPRMSDTNNNNDNEIDCFMMGVDYLNSITLKQVIHNYDTIYLQLFLMIETEAAFDPNQCKGSLFRSDDMATTSYRCSGNIFHCDILFNADPSVFYLPWCLSYCNSLAIDHQPVMILQSFGGILGQGAITPEIHQWHWCSVLQDTRAFSWFSNLGGTQWLGSAKLWSVEGQTGEPNGEYPIFPFVSWLRIHKFLNMAKFEIIYIIHTAS